MPCTIPKRWLLALGLAVTGIAPSAKTTAATVPIPAAPVAPVPLAAEAPPLTLEECVARALAENFELEIQRLTAASAHQDVIIADAAFDPTFTAGTGRFYSQTELLGELVPNSQENTSTVSLGVTKMIDSGAVIGISTNLDRAASFAPGPFFNLNPAYDDEVALTVRQPLLRGAGTAINRAAWERARLGVKGANATLKASVLAVVRNVESAYYNLVFAREQKKVRDFSLQVAEQLQTENEARLKAGSAIELDVLSAQVGVANARLSVVTADEAVKNSEDALLQLIGRFEFDRPIGPVDLGAEVEPDVSLTNSYQLALERYPAHVIAATALEQLKIDAFTANDSRKPQLNLNGSLGLASTEQTSSRAATEAFSGNGYNWAVDLTLTIPWGHRADTARYRQAVAAVDSQRAGLAETDQNLLVQVRSAIRAVQAGVESVKIAAQALDLSKKEYEQEKALYSNGLVTFRLVQDAEADADSAAISELQARVSLRQALSTLSSLETTSLDRYRIKLEE